MGNNGKAVKGYNPGDLGSRFRRLSVWRTRNAPPSELIVPPSNRATICRDPQASKSNPDWLHSVIAKAVLSLALTVIWKLSYAIYDGLLPILGEVSGLASEFRLGSVRTCIAIFLLE